MKAMWRVGVGVALVGLCVWVACAVHSRGAASGAPEPSSQAQSQEAEEEPQMDRDAFAQRAIQALRDSGEKQEIHYDAKEFMLRVGSGDGRQVFLSNLFAEYLASPADQRDQVFKRITRVSSTLATQQLPATFAEARASVLPMVKPRAFFEQLPALFKSKTQESPIPWKPLAGFLGVGVAFDAPDTFRYLNAEDLQRWGVTFEQALEVGLANLRQRSTEPLTALAPGTCQAPWKDSSAAARVLLEDVVRRCQVHGTPVVLVPHRDLLLITGADDEDGLKQISDTAMRALMAPRSLDGRALRLAPEGWVPFMPEQLNGAWNNFRQLELISQARDYAAQEQDLQKSYQARNEDVFVAAFNPYQDDRGRTVSYSLWLKGVDSLLPRTELLFFMDPALGDKAPPVAVARWEEVEKDARGLLEPVPGLYPARYRVKTFPTPEQLARWGSRPGGPLGPGGP